MQQSETEVADLSATTRNQIKLRTAEGERDAARRQVAAMGNTVEALKERVIQLEMIIVDLMSERRVLLSSLHSQEMGAIVEQVEG